MGVGGISIWQLLIVLAIVILLFGTKRLRNLGGDLGAALKSFKQAVRDGGEDEQLKPDEPEAPGALSREQQAQDAGGASDGESAAERKERS